MRKMLLCLCLAVAVPFCAVWARAADTAGKTPPPSVAAPAAKTAASEPAAKAPEAAPEKDAGPKQAKPAHPVKGSQAVEAAEQRYQNYLDREKTDAEASLAKQRGKMEDKYKGFVRTVKPKDGSKNGAKKSGD